jgi:hypothetical protein
MGAPQSIQMVILPRRAGLEGFSIARSFGPPDDIDLIISGITLDCSSARWCVSADRRALTRVQ